jgi:hypothetical protein
MNGPEAVAAFVFFGGAFWVLRPLAGAVAKRIAGDTKRGPTPDQITALRADFAERLLAKQREGERLMPPRS